MYQMIEVSNVPNGRLGKKQGRWVTQLRGYIASGKKQVKLDIPSEEASKAYNGLSHASSYPEFISYRIRVSRDRDTIYLIRQ